MKNNQTQNPSKDMSEKEEIKNTSKDQPKKRQRTSVSIGSKGRKELDILKQNSSCANPKDSTVTIRAMEFAIFHKQDLNGDFEKFATLTDIERSNKKHIGKLNAAFEIFQAESFQSDQFLLQSLKQLSEQLKELLEQSKFTI